MILFELECATEAGESVAVLGTGPLGDWDPSSALVLERERAGTWSGHIQAPPGGVEFRYAVVDASGAVLREEAPEGGRTCDPKARHTEIVSLRHIFGDFTGGSEELMRCNSRPASECGDAATEASTQNPLSSSTLAASEAEGASAGSTTTPEAKEQRVLQTLQVDPSVRFGRFSHTPGAFEEKYALDEDTVLGTGMSGGVLVAHDRATGRQVAVKTLSIENLDNSKLGRVMAEVENQLMMDHPSIVRLLEVFEEPGQLRLVMERMRGPDLFDHLAGKGRYTERDAAICVRQMVAAVAYCHRNGVCHRDLKLENFCLEGDSEDARVKLIDFGLSSVFESDELMTHACGSLYYVAPEVLRQRYDKKCDVWSLGVIAYILLDGKPPFLGKDDRTTYLKITKCDYKFREERWGRISSLAKDFVSTLLQIDVATRPDIDTVLAHPWLADAAGEVALDDLKPLDSSVLDSMRSFSKSNTLKRAVLRAITPVATLERVADWVDHFEALDQDGDGKVSIKDLARRLVDYGGLSKSEAAQLSAMLAEADEGGDLVSYSAFLASCTSAHVSLDDNQLRSLFSRLDTNRSGTVSSEDVHKALGDLVDIESLQTEFAGRELTYSDFRWLMSIPGLGPTILGWRHLLGASSSLETSWKHSRKVAKKVADESQAMGAARRENMAWRVMYMNTQKGKGREAESSEVVPSQPDERGLRLPGSPMREDGMRPMPTAELSKGDEDPVSFVEAAGASMGMSPVLVPVQTDEDELSVWQCATVAAKDGCTESARVENMLWRKMHLQSKK